MDVAIKFEKINLGNDKFVFKPVGIIRGKYQEEDQTFQTVYGDLCAPISGALQFEDNYFGYYSSLEELKKVYDGTEEEIIMQYYDEYVMCFYFGCFDYVESKIKLLSIPFDEVEQVLESQDEEETEYEVDFDDDFKVIINLERLNELIEIDDIDKLHAELDEIIKLATYSPEEVYFSEENLEDNSNKNLNLEKNKSKTMTLKELRKEVKDVIKGQDKTVNDVTRAIIVNQNSSNPKHKSHILIMGPSGTGKTEMINIIANKMGIPYFKADATAYTKEGYKGKSVYSMLNGLIAASNGDLEKAQRGILIIDEIDKKLSERSDDVSGVDVINSLLKILDRDIIEVDVPTAYNEKTILFDTSNLTVIFMGAFAELYGKKEKEKKKSIGFDTDTEEKKKEKIIITDEDLVKAGMPPEFLGRIHVRTNTRDLEIEDLVEILYKSKGGAIDLETEFCKDLGITFKYTSGYIKEIAKKAHQSKTGARNLKKLVRESLDDAYDEILSGKKVKVLKLTKETALNNKKYYTE